MDAQTLTTEIKAFLGKRHEVLLAFIFGSFTENRLTRESDVDVAILFRNTPDYSLIVDIMDGISEISDRDTDIVVLNNASPIVKMQILKKGWVLKNDSERIYNDFFLRTIKEYDDLKMVRKEQEERILEGRRYVRA
jgi:predicted nucleotidyltransferase